MNRSVRESVEMVRACLEHVTKSYESGAVKVVKNMKAEKKRKRKTKCRCFEVIENDTKMAEVCEEDEKH